MLLTNVHCKNATCPQGKQRKRLNDGDGLYLEVTPSSKRWFFRFYSPGKDSRIAIGQYPKVGLSAARKAKDEAKAQQSQGKDPATERKIAKLQGASIGDTFKATALEWYGKHSPRWSNHHAIREKRNLEKDLFPYIGERRMEEVRPVELLAVVRKVEERGALDVASRVLGTARAVWRYGVATARCERDITADLVGALTPHKGRHFAAITDPVKLGQLLRVIRGYQGGPIVRTALQLAPILFQRPGELRGMAWSEVDLEKGIWTIPAARMKRQKEGKEYGADHLVPLPRQAVEMLRDLQPLTGNGPMVFPGERSKTQPISDNTLRAALGTLGYGSDVQSVHGFRATARTILAEVLEFDPFMIEAQLAHAVKDANGRAYNRTSYVMQRAAMLQAWADYLDKLRDGDNVIKFPTKAA